MSAAGLSSNQLSLFNAKYNIVLSSCRLLTEAQAALDRSIKDFVETTEALSPYVVGSAISTNAQAIAESADRTSSNVIQEKSTHDLTKNHQVDPIKKEKKVRDPDMPKRPGSAFFLYQTEKRASTKAALPDTASAVEVQKAVADQWQTLDEVARRPYVERHEKDLQEYERKLEAYNIEKGIVPTLKGRKAISSHGFNDQDAATAAASLVERTNNVQDSPVPKPKKRDRKSVENSQKSPKQVVVEEKRDTLDSDDHKLICRKKRSKKI